MSVYNTKTDNVFSAAPSDEPARQRFFLDMLRERIFGGQKESGSKKACVVTFGCQMNARDSEKLTGMLLNIGYTECADERDADIVLFNTCTVRENANEHLYGRLGRLKQIKKARPDMIIGVCGCMMQETDEVAKLRVKYPYVDVIFGTHNLFTFPELLFTLIEKRSGVIGNAAEPEEKLIASSADDILRYEKLLRYGSQNRKELDKLRNRPVVSVWEGSERIVEELPSRRKFAFKQGINIMFGCNNFCSYCIVPYVRGREKSRAPEDIYKEILKCADEGVKEIMLLGQNVNSYDGGMGFPELLKKVDEITDDTGIERIRFMTSHPKDLSDELIEVMAGAKKVCRQFHLPLQSGSDTVLRRMNRHYGREQFIERAKKLKAAMPDISLSTDIIVGFPGETEDDFKRTLEVLENVRFDFAYTFIYSKREGTPAAAFTDQIPADTVKERFDRLLKLQNRITSENLERLKGSTGRVLFENISEYDDALVTGKLDNGTTVHVPGDEGLIGSICSVRLNDCHGFYYTGEVVR